MQCILKQDIGWFDEHPAGQLPTAVTTNMAKVQDGLGRKIGDIVLNGISGGCLFFRAAWLSRILFLFVVALAFSRTLVLFIRAYMLLFRICVWLTVRA